MATDYEIFYKENPHGLGKPTKAFVQFFRDNQRDSLNVRDVGCGQGRDALFIARLGHHVTAVDMSPTSIKDLINDAQFEGLNISGIVAEFREHKWHGQFDIVVIDRTLHMLDADDRVDVLGKLLNLTTHDSYVLIADERSNMPAFVRVFEE